MDDHPQDSRKATFQKTSVLLEPRFRSLVLWNILQKNVLFKSLMMILEPNFLNYNLKCLFPLMEIWIAVSHKTYGWLLLGHIRFLFCMSLFLLSSNYLVVLVHLVQCCCMCKPIHWFIDSAWLQWINSQLLFWQWN